MTRSPAARIIADRLWYAALSADCVIFERIGLLAELKCWSNDY